MTAWPGWETVEALLRRVGPPAAPPARLHRAVLGLVDEPGSARRPRRPAPVALVASLALVLAGGLLLARSLETPPALDLPGPNGATAHVVVGNPAGANRPLQLQVQRLTADRYYELWSVHGNSRMLLATFMTNHDGSCRINVSIPSTIRPGDLVIAPGAGQVPA